MKKYPCCVAAADQMPVVCQVVMMPSVPTRAGLCCVYELVSPRVRWVCLAGKKKVSAGDERYYQSQLPAR